MDPILTFSAILTAIIGGVTEALAGKAIDATPGTARKIKHAIDLVEQTEPQGVLDQAVQRAVEGARVELLETYAFSSAGDEVARDVVALFEKYELFAGEVARRVIFEGKPDFEHLRKVYLDREESATSDRWKALAGPLQEFFSDIEQRLNNDPEVSSMLSGLRQAALLTNIDAHNPLVLARLDALLAGQQRAIAAQERTADATERTADLLKRMAPPKLTPAETRFLHELRDKCNELPLANDQRSAGDARSADAQLINVYIDLRTTTAADLELVCDRLDVPQGERAALRLDGAWSVGEAKRGRSPSLALPDVSAAEEELRAMLEALPRGQDAPATAGRRRKTDDDAHPLMRWAKDEETLRRALEPLTALEAVQRRRRFVLLGDPGSGKSTFVNFLCYVLAGAMLEAEPDWQGILEHRFAAPLYPIRVVLREWSATLTEGSRAGLALAHEALAACVGDAGRLAALLENAQTLVCFDGLDEVPPAEDAGAIDRRRMVLESVEAFCTEYRQCAVLVTSRIKPYENPAYQLAGLPALRLDDLDGARIERFIARWYGETERIKATCAGGPEEAGRRLRVALETRPKLREMAGRPLLLTMLARVNARRGLPESRAELYHECVEQLLWEWEKRKEDGDGAFVALDDLLVEPGKQRADVDRVLWQMTFEAHRQSGSQAATLPISGVESRLAALHPHKYNGVAWARRVVDLMSQRGGLLADNGVGGFAFPHTSLQEYLAARWLIEEKERVSEAAQLAEVDTWREVILLACGYLTWQGRYSDAQALVHELIAGRLAMPDDIHRLLVAGMAWQEFDPSRATTNTGKALLERIPAELTRAMQDARVPAVYRRNAGLLAAELDALPDDLDDLVAVPGTDLRMGKYPVTNAQFQRFVDAGGYAAVNEERWWSEEGRKYKQQWGWQAPRSFGDRRFSGSTQPAIVSWYEAEAYCAWLAATRAHGDIGAGETVRLPTQAEWEAATRNGQPVPAKADEDYPWRGPFDTDWANTQESSLGQTTPVHMYAQGATRAGIHDLAGNVWEWTGDLHSRDKDGDARYWIKGGSWAQGADSARASAAGWGRAYLGHANFGFRVVVVPISRSR